MAFYNPKAELKLNTTLTLKGFFPSCLWQFVLIPYQLVCLQFRLLQSPSSSPNTDTHTKPKTTTNLSGLSATLPLKLHLTFPY